jgi:transposase
MVLKEDNIGQRLLIPIDLTDMIPEDHVCFFVENLVKQIDFNKWDEKYKYNAGNKAFPRAMLCRIVIMAYLDGITSSRRISRLAEENIPYIYLAGGETPKYRVIQYFKTENQEFVKELLALTVAVARESGLTKLNTIGIDGTTIKASATSNSSIKEEDLRTVHEYLQECKKTDQKENEEYGDKRGEEVPPELTTIKKVKKLVKQIKNNETIEYIEFTEEETEKIEKTIQEMDKIHETQENRDKDPKSSKLSLTDPEARWMKNKKGFQEISYNIQHTTDCGSGIIIRTDVIQDPTDHYQLPIQLDGLKQDYGVLFNDSLILADTIYNTSESMEYVYENGWNAFVPSRSQATKSKNPKLNKFAKANFIFDFEKNHYICPNNQILHHQNTYNEKNKIKKVYYSNACKNCPIKDECSPNQNWRIITDYSTDYQLLMAQKMEKEESKKIYKKRIISERPFAHIKKNLRYTETNLRGKDKIQNEMNLIASVHNIKLLYNHMKNQINQQTQKNT